MSPQEISTENLDLQQPSSFFRLLPRELRDVIYSYMETGIRHDCHLGGIETSLALPGSDFTDIDVEVVVKNAPYVHVLEVCKRMYFEYRQSLGYSQVSFNVTVEQSGRPASLMANMIREWRILSDYHHSYDFLDPVLRRALRIDILINCNTFNEDNAMTAQKRLIKILSPKTTKLESLRIGIQIPNGDRFSRSRIFQQNTYPYIYHLPPKLLGLNLRQQVLDYRWQCSESHHYQIWANPGGHFPSPLQDLATHGYLYHVTQEPEEPNHKDGNNCYAKESASLPYWSNKEIISQFRKTRSGRLWASYDSFSCPVHRNGAVNRSWRDKRANVLDWHSDKGCYTAPETDMD